VSSHQAHNGRHHDANGDANYQVRELQYFRVVKRRRASSTA
jgi:hypothetical protein